MSKTKRITIDLYFYNEIRKRALNGFDETGSVHNDNGTVTFDVDEHVYEMLQKVNADIESAISTILGQGGN